LSLPAKLMSYSVKSAHVIGKIFGWGYSVVSSVILKLAWVLLKNKSALIVTLVVLICLIIYLVIK